MKKYIVSLLFLSSSSAFSAEMPFVYVGQSNNAGHADDVGTKARFSNPSGLARDSLGNLYICDASNHVIRKITANGNVTTIAGRAGEPGAVNGQGAAARFHFPSDLTIAPDGSLYVADTSNHCIRKISVSGLVTTLAGALGNEDDVDFTRGPSLQAARAHIDGAGAAARFNSPSGIIYTPSGHLFVSDTGNQLIRRVDMKGRVVTVAGMVKEWGAIDGKGTRARFHSPMGLCLGADGAIYIADSMNHCIRRMTLKGQVSTYAGNAKEPAYQVGRLNEARFAEPRDIALHPQGGFILCESLGNSILRISAAGIVSRITMPDGSLSCPSAAICDERGMIYISNTLHHTIIVAKE